jgi:hypothetical protein
MAIRPSYRVVPLQVVQSQPDAWVRACLPESLRSAPQRLVQPPLVARILDHALLELVLGIVFEIAQHRPDGSCILHVFLGVSLLVHPCASIGAAGGGRPLEVGVAGVDNVGRRRGKGLEGLARRHFRAAVLS